MVSLKHFISKIRNINIRSSVIIPGRVRTSISFHALNAEGKEHGKLDDGQAKGVLPRKGSRNNNQGNE